MQSFLAEEEIPQTMMFASTIERYAKLARKASETLKHQLAADSQLLSEALERMEFLMTELRDRDRRSELEIELSVLLYAIEPINSPHVTRVMAKVSTQKSVALEWPAKLAMLIL